MRSTGWQSVISDMGPMLPKRTPATSAVPVGFEVSAHSMSSSRRRTASGLQRNRRTPADEDCTPRLVLPLPDGWCSDVAPRPVSPVASGFNAELLCAHILRLRLVRHGCCNAGLYHGLTPFFSVGVIYKAALVSILLVLFWSCNRTRLTGDKRSLPMMDVRLTDASNGKDVRLKVGQTFT